MGWRDRFNHLEAQRQSALPGLRQLAVAVAACVVLGACGTSNDAANDAAAKAAAAPVGELAKGTVIAVGNAPEGLDISADSKWLYATSNGDNTLAVVDLANRNVSKTIDGHAPIKTSDDCPDNFCRGVGAVGVAVDANGRRAYVSSLRPDALAFVDLDKGRIVRTVRAQRFPQNVLLSPDGRRAYVMNVVSNTVSVFETANGRALGRFTLKGGDAHDQPFGRPVGMVLSPDGKRLFVTNGVAGTVEVFNTLNRRVLGSIDAPGALDVQLDPHSGNLLVLARDGIVEYDAQTLKPANTLHFCGTPSAYHFVLSPDGSTLAISLSQDGTVATVARDSGKVSGGYAAGDNPQALRYTPDGATLAVVSNGGVVLFDTSDHSGARAYVAKSGELFCPAPQAS
ncbi:MAG: beta-propeller fold lactonase family protein [Paraburkholderia sp.]|jgi:DNA-binding beta-propeller fold protein YncE|uniref:YncE family protein n=1 Tax=Burkholderiaceae TaxID=119060 RepID=UPI0010F712F4|nr:beta-propeller fold lactonase family protein [Burkholderia sp. 4M9327F10]